MFNFKVIKDALETHFAAMAEKYNQLYGTVIDLGQNFGRALGNAVGRG